MKDESFEEMVKQSWTTAVAIASSNIYRFTDQMLKGLHSHDPEVRSAAIAAFTEAKVVDAHDAVMALIDDENDAVRDEVAEYLDEFAVPKDAESLLASLRNHPRQRFLFLNALERLTGRNAGLFNEEDPEEVVEKQIRDWRDYLLANGFIK